MKRLLPALLILLAVSSAQPKPKQDVPDFMRRKVTVVEPGYKDEPGVFPKGPASICIEGPPQQQCYTAAEDFGGNPTVSLVQVEKDVPALLFSAASGGVSGWQVHFALLHPGSGNKLKDLFRPGVTVSNQNQQAFFNEPSISESPIFLIADALWGSGEAHYGPHRFMVSAYLRRISSDLDDEAYYLEDQYMTVKKYNLVENADVLASETQEILARLRRVKMERQKVSPAPQ